MKCANCGSELPSGANFCLKCGAKKEKPVEFKCPKCGTNLPKNSEFCYNCGQNLKEEVYEAKVERLAKKYFGNAENLFGDNIIFLADRNSDGMLPYDLSGYIKKYGWDTKPLLYFMYSNKGEGFVLTNRNFAYFYNVHEATWSFALNEIKSAWADKAILADVMYLDIGYISNKIYLTGLRNAKEFPVLFDKFIKELNGTSDNNKVDSASDENLSPELKHSLEKVENLVAKYFEDTNEWGDKIKYYKEEGYESLFNPVANGTCMRRGTDHYSPGERDLLVFS